MFTIEPEGIAKGTTTHNTLGKEKISFNHDLERSLPDSNTHLPLPTSDLV